MGKRISFYDGALVSCPDIRRRGEKEERLCDALLGKSGRGRDELVVEGTQAKTVLRREDWVFIPPHDGPAVNVETTTELGNSPAPQLYRLSVDIGQVRNVEAEREDIVRAMSARLHKALTSTQTRPIAPTSGKPDNPGGGGDR